MRIRAVLATAGLVLTAAAKPSHAAPPSTITVQGASTAWTTFDVPANVTLDYRNARVTTSGRFGGFYLDISREFGGVGAVMLRDFHAPGDTPHTQAMGVGPGDIARGRYRLYLVADAYTVVRIPVRGMTSRTVRPTSRTDAAAAVQKLTPTALGVRGRQPVLAARRSVAFSSILLDDVQLFAGNLAVCITKVEQSCGSGADGARTGYFVNPYGAYPFVWTVVYAPGAKSGRLDAVQEAENVAGVKYAVGASFTLTLV